MSEIRLIICEADEDWSGIVHGGSGDLAIAALSADPATLKELEAACGRYEKPVPGRPFFANLSRRLCDEPHDAGLVVIDLIARLIVVDSTYSSPERAGAITYHDGEQETDKWLRYHLADDWLFSHEASQWRSVAERRRRERAARPLIDARSVFYGPPMLEFVAREIFAAFAGRKPSADSDYDTIKDIHAAWLLTPRDDLGGVCPRDVALERRDQIGWDLQNQADRWSRLDERPPGLDESSFAFRYGGFGTHELVKYYDLVRELLWSSRDRLTPGQESRSPADGVEALQVGDFLASEVSRLEGVRDQWLNTPDPECHMRTPRSIIDRERARLPEGVSGHEAMVDPDCPCCQMMAELPGPAFWHLDGCEMDDDFAFDIYHRTRETWEAERQEWMERSRRFDAEWAERERLGVTRGDEDDDRSVWTSSFSVDDAADLPLGVRLFGIGCHLAELIAELRIATEQTSPQSQAQQFIDILNRDFGNLREVLLTSEPSLGASLLHPVIDRFTESLAAVAVVRTDLAAKCESLTNALARFLAPPAPKPSWDSGEEETPF